MTAPITSITGRPLTDAEVKGDVGLYGDPDAWAVLAHQSGALDGDSIEKTKSVHKSGLVRGQLWERLAEHAATR